MGAANSTHMQPPIPSFPYNSQLGEFHFPLDCKLLGANISLDGTFYALGPVVANPGQEIYFTDSVTRIRIPESLANAGAILNASRTESRTFVDLNFESASPSTLHVFPDGLVVNSGPLKPNQTNVVRAPAKGTLPPIGPITVGKLGELSSFYLGELVSEITLYNASNDVIFGPYNLTCPALANPPQLGLVNIAGPANSSVASPSLGYKPKLGGIVDNQEVGYYHTSLSCDIGSYKDVILDTYLGGKLFGSYPSGSKFQLTDIRSSVSVPQSLLSAFKTQYFATGTESIIESIVIGMSNASPLTKNILKKPISTSATIPDSGSVTLHVPESGALNSGAFTAGPDVNALMLLTLNSVGGEVVLSNSSNPKIASLPIACLPTVNPLALYGILIAPASS